MFLVSCMSILAGNTTEPSDRSATASKYFNATYYWSVEDDGWGMLEFFSNGKCSLKEDLVTDYNTCKGTYKISGNKIILNWGGYVEYAYFSNNRRTLTFHQMVFHRIE